MAVQSRLLTFRSCSYSPAAVAAVALLAELADCGHAADQPTEANDSNRKRRQAQQRAVGAQSHQCVHLDFFPFVQSLSWYIWLSFETRKWQRKKTAGVFLHWKNSPGASVRAALQLHPPCLLLRRLQITGVGRRHPASKHCVRMKL
jgi:hypothetical protein